MLMVQSNNATYGGTGQIDQQFAITRARAMESRREIAVATTNGISGFITRDGAVASRTQEFTAQSMVVEMPLRSALTPAVKVAPWLERGVALVAVLACVAALWHRTQRSRRAKLEHSSIGSRSAVLRRSEQTRFSSANDDEVAPASASGASDVWSEAIRPQTSENEIPVEPTDTAADDPEQDGSSGIQRRRPRTDSSDHPDLQRVGEHRTHRQPDP
jgi:hypothetical protein